MSSREPLFQPSDPLSVGDELIVTVHWPALLDNISPLNLVLEGNVTRFGAMGCAVSINEFRTRASQPLMNSRLIRYLIICEQSYWSSE